MKKFIEIYKDTFLSAFIGVIVGTFYMLVILSRYIGAKEILISTLLSALIGIIIGSSAKFIFFLLKKNIIKNIRTAYIIESILIVSSLSFALIPVLASAASTETVNAVS